MPLLRVLILLSVTIALAGQAIAQLQALDDDRIAEIDALVETRMAELNVPGVALALIEDGEIVHARGFGTVGDGSTAMTPETKFQIGSVSKSFSALAILHLVETGVLELDATLVSYVPTFQTRIAAQSDKITVRHLLSHRSGFATVYGNRNQGPGATPDTSVKDLLSETRRTKLLSEPGAVYAYSNANYQWLGYLVEHVTERPFSEVFTEVVSARYDLPQTRLGPSESSEGRTSGHRYWFGTPRPYDWRPARVTWPQGGVETTANDIAKLLTVLIDEFRATDVNPLFQDMIASPASDADMSYGLGWVIKPKLGLIQHTGRNPGFEAVAGFSPEDGFGFVVLANSSTSFGNRNVSSLGSGVIDLMLGQEVTPSTPSLFERIGRMIIFAIPVLLLISVLLFVWKGRRDALEPISSSLSSIALRLVLPSALLFALAYFLYAIVPSFNGVTFQALYMFNPDLGVVLGLGAALALVWGVLRPILRLRMAAR